VITGSLALLSDAAHMFTDTAALAIALAAIRGCRVVFCNVQYGSCAKKEETASSNPHKKSRAMAIASTVIGIGKLALPKTFGIVTVAFAAIGANADKVGYTSAVNGKFLGKTGAVLMVSKTF
jgi:hypothetical protein